MQTGLPVWTKDEAGPFPTVPYPGQHWRPEGEPVRYPHEFPRAGTAKQLTLFHPASGVVRMKGVTSTANATLHPWLKAELGAILADLPEPGVLPPEENRRYWARWQEGLTVPLSLAEEPPPLRLLLVLDNLTGHYTAAFVRGLFAHGIMPLFTPWADPQAARARRAAVHLTRGDHHLGEESGRCLAPPAAWPGS